MKVHIETPRLIIREVRTTDDLGFWELDKDPEVHQYLGGKPATSMEEVKAIIDFIIQQYADNGIGRFSVLLKENQEFIGWTGLKLITETTNNHLNYYDLGYRFIQKHWGKGYATEAAKAMIDYGFKEMNLENIYAIADYNNEGSKNVLTKLGFNLTGQFDYHGVTHNWFELDKNTEGG